MTMLSLFLPQCRSPGQRSEAFVQAMELAPLDSGPDDPDAAIDVRITTCKPAKLIER